MNDTYLLKLSGKAELPDAILPGHNFHVALDGSIVSETISDNEDGTFTHTYTFRPVKVDVLTPKGEMLHLKDSRSNSQLIRGLLYKRWMNLASSIPFDEFYDRISRGIMRDIDEFIERYAER